MKPAPVRRAKTPRYPTRLEIDSDPQLLASLPPTWRANPEIERLARLLLSATVAASASSAWAQDAQPTKAPKRGSFAAVVAPLFEHGEGRGATGCVVVAPPAFLSEEEAQQIIAEELARHGLPAGTSGTTMSAVRVPERTQGKCRPGGKDEPIYEKPETASSLRIAYRNDDRKLAAAVVVKDRLQEMGGVQPGQSIGKNGRGSMCFSTVQSYDLKGTAAFVRTQAERQGRGVYLGVFYDPATPKKATSRELLRQQVADFAEWLKGQGVI